MSKPIESAPEPIQAARDRLRPTPKPHYPAPWRVAETNGEGHVVVVCADGHYTCTAPTVEAARIIVLAVNAWAWVS